MCQCLAPNNANTSTQDTDAKAEPTYKAPFKRKNQSRI